MALTGHTQLRCKLRRQLLLSSWYLLGRKQCSAVHCSIFVHCPRPAIAGRCCNPTNNFPLACRHSPSHAYIFMDLSEQALQRHASNAVFADHSLCQLASTCAIALPPVRVTILDVQATHLDCFAIALLGSCITAAGDTLLQLWRTLNNRDGALLRCYCSNLQVVCSRRYLSAGSSSKQLAAVTPASTRLQVTDQKEGERLSTETCKGLAAHVT